jgi:hypothetical protein
MEVYRMGERYVQGYETYWDVLDTFSFNLGLIYDSMINTLLDLIDKALNPGAGLTSQKYLMLGYGLGNIFYLIFFSA